MNNKTINLHTATYVGIDAHPTEHTALAINCFEEEKGKLRFPGIHLTRDSWKTAIVT